MPKRKEQISVSYLILILSSSRRKNHGNMHIIQIQYHKKIKRKKREKINRHKTSYWNNDYLMFAVFSISGFSLISSLLFSLHYHIIETVYQRTVSLPHPPTHNHRTPPHSHPGCPPPPGITSPTTTICSINSRHRRYNTNSNSSKWWVGPLLLIFGCKFGLFENK